MDDRSFDTFVRSLASGANRRQLLKGLLGLGGVAIAGAATVDAEAARRPTPTPRPPSCPGQQTWNGSECVCPAGSDNCGPDCCPTGVAQCCDNACCYGYCYGEELCCPTGREFCPITGECCPDGWRCCPEYGCVAPDQCCTTEECSPPLCFTSECTADHVCSEPVSNCTNGGADACCAEGQVCREDGSCCTPVCDGSTCGNDGCGGTCACPEGYGCGDDGECHICTVCTLYQDGSTSHIFEQCGPSCYTYCTPDGVVCLSAGSLANPCTDHDDCQNGSYCIGICSGTFCSPPCVSIT